MFKRFLVSLLMILSIISILPGCASTVPKVDPPKSEQVVIKEIATSTAALVLRKDNDVRVYCTAVWVSQKTLLTAHHCVNAAWRVSQTNGDDDDDEDQTPPNLKGFKVYYITGDEVEGVNSEPSATHLATVAMVDAKRDLALLKADGKVLPPHTFAKLADEPPAIGEHLYILGHVKGLYWSHIEGIVSSHRSGVPTGKLGIKGPFLQVSGPVYYGNSGGGAFNKKGELVGIASFMYRAPQTTMFIHLYSIKQFLKVN